MCTVGRIYYGPPLHLLPWLFVVSRPPNIPFVVDAICSGRYLLRSYSYTRYDTHNAAVFVCSAGANFVSRMRYEYSELQSSTLCVKTKLSLGGRWCKSRQKLECRAHLPAHTW